ncbi:hypothetical protein N0A02_26110 [Paraburkholderia acidicola]|uniref:Uncharacterized protein n=1 Tax=Paraburkholderia acidicola TaxID=1912599 RepID=A0ABV1LUE0_9BURK
MDGKTVFVASGARAIEKAAAVGFAREEAAVAISTSNSNALNVSLPISAKSVGSTCNVGYALQAVVVKCAFSIVT